MDILMTARKMFYKSYMYKKKKWVIQMKKVLK